MPKALPAIYTTLTGALWREKSVTFERIHIFICTSDFGFFNFFLFEHIYDAEKCRGASDDPVPFLRV